MRSTRWPLILTFALVLVLAGSAPGIAQSTTKRINVVLQCPRDLEAVGAGGASANPYRRTANPGDTILWNLVSAGGGNGSDDFTVSSSNWPLAGASYTGTGQIEAQVPTNAATGSYKYTISMTCNGAAVVLDPGMRIGG